MATLDSGSVFVGALLILPGFIFVKITEWVIPSPRRDFSKSIVELTGYSAFNYVAFSWAIVPKIEQWKSFDLSIIDYALILSITIVSPLFFGLLFARFANTNILEKISGIRGSLRTYEPSAWDYFFGQRNEPCWILVRLRNGDSVGGIYDKSSYSSRYPENPSIYIARQYHIDEKGAMTSPAENGCGILIKGEDIHLLEFWDIPESKSKEE